MIIASKGHSENVDSCDNPERVMLSRVMASPMRKSTFPLDGSYLGSMYKIDFEYVCFLCLLDLVKHPWFSLAHLCCAMEEKRIFESVYINYWIEDFMLNINLY